MPSLAELSAGDTQLAATLAAGVQTISENQTITFTKYVRVVLPIDGFVFWVKASLLTPSALLNASTLNKVPLDTTQKIAAPAASLVAQGSLHYVTDVQQNEDETPAVNTVIFTSLSEVDDFNDVGDNVTYIAILDGTKTKYNFNSRASFYQQSGLYHYRGTALYPAMLSQIIDDPRTFDSISQVVSNSLPIWLSFGAYVPPYPGFPQPSFPLYPSYAVPQNIAPPYASIHIEPAQTLALQSTAKIDANSSHWQLLRDLVRITLYGIRNENALSFLDAVNQYSRDTDYIGIMNMPVVRDEKRTQSELNILAMKKTLDFEVSYYQATSRNVARQTLESTLIGFHVRVQTP